MRIVKLATLSIILLTVLGPLNMFAVNKVYAWHTTVQTETLYRLGNAIAKMGIATEYGFIGPAPDRAPQFYCGLIARAGLCSDEMPPNYYFPNKVRIEVTGSDPLGNPLAENRFGDLSVILSPDESGDEQTILSVIFDILLDEIPFGLGDLVKYAVLPHGATHGHGAEMAWAQWDGYTLSLGKERGLKFGFELEVDPTLEGTYTINIHYSADIWIYVPPQPEPPMLPDFEFIDSIDLYDTVNYEYVNTPVTPSPPSGYTPVYMDVSYSYSTSTTDPNGDSLRYQFDWDDGSTTTTDWYTSGATASASHDWDSSGTYSVKVRAHDSTDTWSDWSSCLTVDVVNIDEPVCAMKTKEDGYFYVPNVATNVLKIELLFDEEGFVGDQTGGISPYSSIQHYPDGWVEIKDTTMIAGHFGASEGEPDWCYMADVTGDEFIDIKDILAAAVNYGFNGEYIDAEPDDVFVRFDDDPNLSYTPNDDWLVSIPAGADFFKVYYGASIPIGAMIIFW